MDALPRKAKLSDLLFTLKQFSDRDVTYGFDSACAIVVRIEASLEEVREALEAAQDEIFEEQRVK